MCGRTHPPAGDTPALPRLTHTFTDPHRRPQLTQEWAHALFPQLAFEDLLDRVQKLSGRARVRKRLEDLREKERERFLVRACWN